MNINSYRKDKHIETTFILPKKVMIIGTSGSGKTTLGNTLSKLLKITTTDLDNVYWLPNWQPKEDAVFFSQVNEKLTADSWIICGNYAQILQDNWKRADTIIWLDMPLSVCLWRALKRSIFRIVKQESICNGNYETIGRLIGRKSILRWIWTSYGKRKKNYADVFSTMDSDQNLIRLCNSQQINVFVHSLKKAKLAVDPFFYASDTL